MKNLYQILGVDDTASQQQIKQAYRRLALTLHPDRGGDVSQMALINEAYEILIDPVKRRDFDEAWQAYQTANIDEDGEIQCDGHLAAGSSVPFSKSFKDKHQALIFQYAGRPLDKNTAAGETESFESSCYQVDRADGPQRYHDIFSFIRAKNALAGGSPLSLSLAETLTPVVAAQLLMDFLAGKIWGDELRRVADYLSVSLSRLDRTAGQTSERLLYEGVYEIILMAEAYVPNSGLLLSLKKISDFAKSASEVTLPRILPLFYNKYFRNLFAYALHLYWHTNEDLFDEADLSQFEGFQSARELLESLKDRLSSESNKKQLTTLILYVKLLANLEKDFKKARTRSVTAEDYRESAFHLLDWIPALREGSSQAIIINTFLQIGNQFHQASVLETHPAKKMADEQLALQVYAIAAAISERTTPDIEIYIKNQMIKRVSAFEYQDQSVKEYVPALKKRMLALTNVFPFFESLRSNISYLKQDNQMLHLMRQLLNAMINILEYNKSHREPIAIDHSAVTVLYQAYEACLKNWYQDTYSPETETKFRQDLMDELLFENGWTFWDVEEQTDSPWSMIDRDVQGWIQPSRALPYAEDPAVTIYSAINGAELNSETGEINFFMTPWRRERPEYEKVLSLYDLQEMLQKNLGGAIFSLDPVAPDKPFHPFNQMRFSPSQLCESELLDTMLLTDYILKFLTTNQEVQGQYPFAGRPVASMIEHLPEYLQNIIENFHQGQHSGAIHRFWIEAEAVDVLVSDDIPGEANTTRVRLDNIKMVVKKHRMERDIHGNLVDVGNEDEGWPIYVLTQAQMDELIHGRRSIEGPAMVFIYGQAKLHYWENHAIVHSHTPQHARESLIRLYKQAKAANGKIKQTSTNASLRYRLTKEMAGQSGQPHRYSREFIFAHEFTQHYDEFAQYLPAFGRLKELSKVAALVRFLDGIRLANQETIKAIERCLDNSSHPELEETERYQQLKQGYQKTQASIISQFKELRKKFSLSVLKAQYRKNMQSLRAQIGTIELGPHSDEVNEVCQRCYDDTQRQNGYAVPSSLLWDRINSQRKEFAQQISSSRRASYKKQLDEMFSNRLSSYSKDRLYEAFLQRDIAPLADALAAHNGDEIKRDIQRQYPRSLPNDIGWALDEGNDDAVLRIAASEARLQMQTLKTTKKNVTSGFEAIKFAKHDKPISLTGQCFWVPASVKHEVVLDKAGLSRYSFFVYGGVNVQPRLNIRPGGNGPVGGNRVGGGGGGDGSGGRGGFNRAEIIKGFQSHHLISPTNKATQNHPLLRLAGITTRQQMDARPNRIYLPYQRTGPAMENGKSHHPTRSIHNGRHTQEAMDAVAQRMTAVARTGRAENWSQAQYREGLRSLQAELRQELRTGQVALNSRHEPPNPSRR